MTSKIDLHNKLTSKRSSTANKYCNVYTPVFFDLNNNDDAQNLELLLDQNIHLQVFDAIESQLKDLVKIRNPSKNLSTNEADGKIKSHIQNTPLNKIGVWVYYPWKEKLVHILREDEFIELRTSRNKYKITDAEREVLSGKKIGVIGLSVGQSVSLTLAMERIFGELRIADFDELELTNLNRIRSGVANLGIKKTVLVAREIAEIDPFLKVTCFHEGVTEENIQNFLLDNGKLDILIDECDSVDIKILCRVVAKQFKIPVLMEASDKGTVDVERFDLEPERPILHGFIEHLDISNLKNLKTSEEKIPYILPIAGVETLSSRMKASALEVGQTITTWPQLASAVTFGGGITADICRRILLDQYHASGRYFIDIEELIKDPQPLEKSEPKNTLLWSSDFMESLIKDLKLPEEINSIEPKLEVVKRLVQAAALAPSAGNNQPWKWFFDKKNLWLFHDLLRAESFGNYKYAASYLALGASLENLALKATEIDIGLKIRILTNHIKNYDYGPVAKISFLENYHRNSECVKDDLYKFLEVRYTNRLKGKNMLLPNEILKELTEAIKPVKDANFFYITDDNKKKELAYIIASSEKYRIFIPEGHKELFEKELRWTSEEAAKTKDGLDINSFELSQTDFLGLRLAKDYNAIKLLESLDLGRALEKISYEAVNSSSAIGIITMPVFNEENCLLAGRAVERVWLTANKYQISFQPMLAPILHFLRISHSHDRSMPLNIESIFQKLQRKFNKVFSLENNDEALFLFRLSYSSNPKVKSLRLSVEDLLYIK